MRNHFLRCRIEVGWYPRTCFMGSDRRSSRKHESESSRTERPVYEQTWSSLNTSHNSKTKTISGSDQWFGQCWFYSLKHQLFSSGSFVIRVWRQRSSDQDDYKGKKTDDETCFQNPQSSSWLVFFDRINLDPKIQIKYSDTKNQLADILTKGNVTRDEWNHHLLNLFNISHFSSTVCSASMAKRVQQYSGEERVTAKSKPTMNLVSRCSEKTLDVLASIASESPGKPDMKVNNLSAHGMSTIKEQRDLFETLTHQITQSGMLTRIGLLKSGNLMNLWKLEQGDLFMNNHPVCSQRTRKIYFWPNNKMRSMEWIQLTGKILHGNICLWLVVKKSSVSRAQRFPYFQILLCLGKMSENPLSNIVWEDKLTWFKSSSQYRALDTIDGGPMEFEWNIFPGFTTLQLCNKVQEFLSKMSIQPEGFTGRIIFMSTLNDISWGSKEKKQECELSAQLVSIDAKRFSPGRWSSFGLGSEKKWYSTHESKPQGEWNRVAELMMIKFGESKHPVFRSTSPLSRGVLKSKGGGKLFCADEGTIETVFRTIISVNQLSIYGAVSDLCEECKSCHVR